MDDDNTVLPGFLTHVLSLSTDEGKDVNTNHGSDVLNSVIDTNLIRMIPGPHKQADNNHLRRGR